MNSSKPSPKQHRTPAIKPSSSTDSLTLDLTQPGPEHSQLMKWVGSWDVAFTHSSKEGEPEKQAKGTANITSAYNGRYIREEYSSEFEGKQFMGTGTTGYDRAAKQFVTTWYDNMATGISHLTGTATHEGKEITYHGTMVGPPQKSVVQLRHVVAWESDDHFSITMFHRGEGKERKVMELVYSRITSGASGVDK